MTTHNYPRLVPSAEAVRGIPWLDRWRGVVVRFDGLDDKHGTIVITCGHLHTLARTATACADRLARTYARRRLEDR